MNRLTYHDQKDQCQPDGMHTVKDIMETIVEHLISEDKVEKLRKAEIELQLCKRRCVASKIITLTELEKNRGNLRCKSLQFPGDYDGFKGDIFIHPKHTLKKNSRLD